MRLLRLLGIMGLILFTLFSCNETNFPTHYLNKIQYVHRVGINKKNIIPIIVDHKFGEADKVSIDQAIAEWNYALNGQGELIVKNWEYNLEEDVGFKEAGVVYDKKGIIILMDEGNGRGDILAWTDKVNGNIVHINRDRVKNEDVRYLIMHEIGHTMGSEHSWHGLMHPYYNKEDYQCIDYETVRNVSLIQGYELWRMNYCIRL